ncbi:MAG: hypothetical protein KDB53_20655, partial [Planctomycetes bacterium]|nr:hypothetical protein [Planctomycetota bacterium]
VNTGPLHRHGWAPATWTRPHVLKVAVTSTGTPVPNRVLTITELPASGNPITTTVTTDAQGLATVSAVSSNQMGTGTLIIQSATTNALALPYHRRRFQVTLNLNPPVGLPFIAVQLEHAGALPLPFTLAVDVPLPPPGALFTPFGDINTSLLARGPAFAAIDGLGLFGIPNPTAIADPNYFQVFPITSAIPPGTVAIVQAYARDFSLPFLDGIVISPAATLLF